MMVNVLCSELIYSVKFFYFDNRKDRLRLWDGDYRSRHNRLEWPGFCGMTHPDTVVSPNNEMFIRFKSNNREVSTGFEIRIEEGLFFETDSKFFNNNFFLFH